MFETELQLRIAELAGAYCGFEPVYPVKTNYYTKLTNLISQASIRSSQTVDSPADNDSSSGNFIFKTNSAAISLLPLIELKLL